MKFTLILWIAALLYLCQQIEARTQRFVLADEEAVQGQIEANAVVALHPEKTENSDKTDVADSNSKHDCADNGNDEEEDENVVVIDADDLQRILDLADEAQGRAKRRYKLKMRKRPQGNRRRGNRRKFNRRRRVSGRPSRAVRRRQG